MKTRVIAILLVMLAGSACWAAQFAPGQILVRFKPGTPMSAMAQIHRQNGSRFLDEIPQIGMQKVTAPRGWELDRVRRYAANPNVEFAEPDYFVKPALRPNDPYFWYNGVSWQEQLRRLGAEQAWDITVGDPSVVVAVLDSGIDYTHPDFQGGRLILGPDFANNDGNPYDDYGHGTIVTGVLGATTNNGVGISGATWNNRILAVKIAGADGYATWSWMAKGLTYAADQGARVANISFSSPYSSSTIANAVSYAYQKGVVTIAAAGNSDVPPQYPAAYPEVIAVSGIDGGDLWDCGYGPYIGVCAYSSGVYTTRPPFGTSYYYGTWGGTSVAAPFVAGAAALVLSVNPALTPDQVRDMICRTADDLGAPGWDQYYGWGRVNLYQAVLAARDSLGSQDTTPPTVEIAAPQEAAVVSGVTQVSAAAADNIGVSTVDFYVDGGLVGSDTTAPYSATWDTTGVPSGNRILKAVARDRAGNSGASVPVSVVVDNATTVTESFSGRAGGPSGSPSVSFVVRNAGLVTASLSWTDRRADLDLCLYDATGVLLGRSATATRPEVIEASLAPGTYRLQIIAVSGKASYTLAVTHP